MTAQSLRAIGRRARKLNSLLRVAEYRRALWRGVPAAVEHDRTELPSGVRTVLDVGANRGQFAVVAGRRWPQAALVCFEPLPAPRAVLARVLGRDQRLRIVGAALTDQAGWAEMHVSRAEDSSSLLPITARQVEAFPGTDEVGRTAVRTARLDEEVAPGTIERPAVLKIDVQGSELGVLRGATGLLAELDAILIEASFAELYAGQALADEVIRFLQSHGFALVAITSPVADDRGTVLQADLVFAAGDRTAKWSAAR